MKAFLRSITYLVERFRLETFFYIMDINGLIKYLLEEPHHFTLELVQTEHSSRLVEPEAKFIGVRESTELVKARFKCYGDYEKCDFSLLQLSIESIVHPDLRAEVNIQYGHAEGFRKLPG